MMTRFLQKTRSSSLTFRLLLFLSFIAFILIGANDAAVGILIPSIQAHYSVNKATVSLIFLGGTCGYLISAINSGFLTHKLGNRRYLMLGCSIFLVGALLLSSVPPFIAFAAGLLPLGFGTAVIDAGFNTYIASQPRSTTLLNYLHAFYGVGALLGPLVASTILAVTLPWNSVYLVWMGLAFIVLLGIFSLFRSTAPVVEIETPVSAAVAEPVVRKGLFQVVIQHPSIWLLAVFLFFYVGIEIVVGSWSYTFLTESRHIHTLFAGWMVSGYWFGLTVGRVVLGHIAQRFGERRTIQGCVVGSGVGVLLLWLVPYSPVAALGLFCTGFFLGPLFPTAIAVLTKVVPERNTAMAIGFLISIASVGGALYPWLAGNLAQGLGLFSIMPYVVILIVCMLISWLVFLFYTRNSYRTT